MVRPKSKNPKKPLTIYLSKFKIESLKELANESNVSISILIDDILSKTFEELEDMEEGEINTIDFIKWKRKEIRRRKTKSN